MSRTPAGQSWSPAYVEQCKLRAKIAEYTIKHQIEEDCRKLENRVGSPFASLDPNGPAPGMPHRPEVPPGEPSKLFLQPPVPPEGFEMKVGIIGAGMAGLYTAMILDSMKYIKYEILEASNRAGGRVYTHYFDPVKLDGNYYDVGAMRFPNIPIMHRTFDLFHRLKINEDLSPNPAQETLIRYFLKGPATPLLYNNIRFIPPPSQPGGIQPDIFHVSVANGGTVPNSFVEKGPEAITKPIYDYWRALLSNPDTFDEGWRELMGLDAQSVSVRSRLFNHLRKQPENDVYTDSDLYYVTNWCETMTGSTGSYDGSFVSAVIHSLEFDWPVFPDNLVDDPVPAAAGKNVWRCVNGGSDVITRRMLKTAIADHITLDHKVTRIIYTGPLDQIKHTEGQSHTPRPREVMTVDTVHHGKAVPKKYTHVVNSTTLGCLQTIDTRYAGLDYAHREAIRVLGYERAVKLGIKFQRRWWADDTGQNINQGGQGKTDRPTRVVVYPSYALNTPPGQSGVLLACYNSAQDAARLGSLFENAAAVPQELVYSYVIADLAAMHNIPEQKLRDLTESYHVHNWYGDPLTRGSWGAFGPGQYSSFFGRIQRPQARGHLFFAGDTTSIYPGWIVGSLDSAYRSVRQIVLAELWNARKIGSVELMNYLWELLFFLEWHWGANRYEPRPALPEDINGSEGWQVYLGIIGAEVGL